jgi:hypothetical protein
MYNITLLDLQMGIILGFLIVGFISFMIGVIILVRRTLGSEVSAIAKQTSLLVKKGLAEEVAGLVGNASALLNATNELIRTSAGIGVFLTLLGVGLMVAASWLVFNF